MISYVHFGGGFRGVFDYLFDTGGRSNKIVEVIGGSLISDNVPGLLAELAPIRALRPNIKKPVCHFYISAAPEDGRLSRQTWDSISSRFLELMGLSQGEPNPYKVVRHSETENDHIHIVVSKIGLDGKRWEDGHADKRAKAAMRIIEDEFGLTRVSSKATVRKRALDKAERNKIKNAQEGGKPEPITKATIQNAIDSILMQGPTASEFIYALAAQGITALPNLARTGKLNGFSFGYPGGALKGSELGRDYTLNQLLARGMSYNFDRDFDILKRIKPVDVREKEEQITPLTSSFKETKPADLEMIKNAVDLQMRHKRQSAAQFVAGLMKFGIQVKAALSPNGRLSGFRFGIGDKSFKGSELGFDYGLAGLIRRGLSYSPSEYEKLKKALAGRVAPKIEMVEIATWRNCISANARNLKRKGLTRKQFLLFISTENLFYKRNRDSNLVFYRTASQNNTNDWKSVVMIDKGDRINIHISTEENILAALKYGREKWGTVKVFGDPEFVAFAKYVATKNGIILADDRTKSLTKDLKMDDPQIALPDWINEMQGTAPKNQSKPLDTDKDRSTLR